MKINEENWLSLVTENLILLKDAFADDVIPSMLYDGDEEEKIKDWIDLEIIAEDLGIPTCPHNNCDDNARCIVCGVQQ